MNARSPSAPTCQRTTHHKPARLRRRPAREAAGHAAGLKRVQPWTAGPSKLSSLTSSYLRAGPERLHAPISYHIRGQCTRVWGIKCESESEGALSLLTLLLTSSFRLRVATSNFHLRAALGPVVPCDLWWVAIRPQPSEQILG